MQQGLQKVAGQGPLASILPSGSTEYRVTERAASTLGTEFSMGVGMDQGQAGMWTQLGGTHG